MNYYQILGVDKTAGPDEIKSAFRKLAKQHHPDLGGDSKKFQEINQAYEVLGDPQKKQEYDFRLNYGNYNQNPFRSNPFESNEINIENIFDVFFNIDRARHARNKNIRISIEIPFLETLNDQVKIIDFNLSNGTETLEIKIPAGVENNNILTVNGKGDNAITNIPRGNLEIIIKVIPHEKYVRVNDDIITDITIDCFQAMLGADKVIDTPNGKKINLKIPAGTQNNTVFGITDLGFPSRARNVRGKFLVRINVLIPQNLTKKQLELLNQIVELKPDK